MVFFVSGPSLVGIFFSVLHKVAYIFVIIINYCLCYKSFKCLRHSDNTVTIIISTFQVRSDPGLARKGEGVFLLCQFFKLVCTGVSIVV